MHLIKIILKHILSIHFTDFFSCIKILILILIHIHTQVKFNSPSSKQFSQQKTASSGGGGTYANKASTKMGSTLTSVTPTSSEDQLTSDENDDEEEEETVHTGFLKEWTLMLHGTREPPYGQLSVRDPHSKLAIVKKAHTIAGPDTTVSPKQQSAY